MPLSPITEKQFKFWLLWFTLGSALWATGSRMISELGLGFIVVSGLILNRQECSRLFTRQQIFVSIILLIVALECIVGLNSLPQNYPETIFHLMTNPAVVFLFWAWAVWKTYKRSRIPNAISPTTSPQSLIP